MLQRLIRSTSSDDLRRKVFRCGALAIALLAIGCGTTQSRSATEQMLTSDAVDRSVARIDFRPLSGQKVFLDVEYVRNVKGIGSVNSEYVISSLRQQLLAAGCLLQEGKHLADYIVEVRMGALGLDGNEVIYGIPANNALGAASALVPTVPVAPTIPELALAKKNDQRAAAKIGAFAYHRVTREVVWQSGTKESVSSARDAWIAGIGPFQSGTIRKETRFAPGVTLLPIGGVPSDTPNIVKYNETRVYQTLSPPQTKLPPVVVADTKAIAASDVAIAEIPVQQLESFPPDAAARLMIPGQKIHQISAETPAPAESERPRSRRVVSPLELESRLLEDEFSGRQGNAFPPPADLTPPDAPGRLRFRSTAPPDLESFDDSGKNQGERSAGDY